MQLTKLAVRSLPIILILLSFSLILAPHVSAASCSGVETSILECEGGGDSGIYHILSLILDIMTIGIGILAVLGIIIVGIQYLTAGGDTARTTKAKRRLLEIVVGVVCYVLLYGFLSWLTPGGSISTNPGDMSDANIGKVSISYSGKTYVGQTFVPKVTFNKDATNKTYSLKSNATGTVTTSGRGAKCVHTGKASIEVIAANGQSDTLSVNCREEPEPTSPGESTTDPSGAGDGVITTGSQANIKLNGNPNMRKETWNIINDHRLDFNYLNYHKVIKNKYGSYKGYLKKLGGVFAKYADTSKIKVKTAADFQEAAEYVWGLMTIWGWDYSGHDYAAWRNNNPWRDTGKSDRFRVGWSAYYGQYGNRKEPIDKKLQRLSTSSVCSTTQGIFISSTSLKYYRLENDSSGRNEMFNKFGKITRTDKLQVGDVLYFYPVTKNGGHIATVGEVYKDYVIVYDGGIRFPRNGTYKFKLNRTQKKPSDSVKGTTFSQFYEGWIAVRPWQIDQSVTLKGLN